MRSTVIAAMIAAAITSGRRAAPRRGTEMSGAVVTAALFANLRGGVNAGAPILTVVPDKRAPTQDHGPREVFGGNPWLPARAQSDPFVRDPGSARAYGRACPGRRRCVWLLAAQVIPQPVHVRN
ncbi:hypothetical protein GCM10007858_49210 [Bradyrhizobium liaoningense]|nr:hypothetical protein GCM10007858_49210 [Bradyrhizobium liaoningense]